MKSVGTTVRKTQRQGGGAYVVIGIVNCNRCHTLLEEREVTDPSKSQRKRGRYYAQYIWCWKYGLYDFSRNSNTTIKRAKTYHSEKK